MFKYASAPYLRDYKVRRERERKKKRFLAAYLLGVPLPERRTANDPMLDRTVIKPDKLSNLIFLFFLMKMGNLFTQMTNYGTAGRNTT